MLTFKETFSVNLGGNKTKKVKGASYTSEELNRELFIHADIENEKHTSVSDKITGYRLFNFSEKHDKIREEQIKERIDQFIRHYSLPCIQEEFQRVENLLSKEERK